MTLWNSGVVAVVVTDRLTQIMVHNCEVRSGLTKNSLFF